MPKDGLFLNYLNTHGSCIFCYGPRYWGFHVFQDLSYNLPLYFKFQQLGSYSIKLPVQRQHSNPRSPNFCRQTSICFMQTEAFNIISVIFASYEVYYNIFFEYLHGNLFILIAPNFKQHIAFFDTTVTISCHANLLVKASPGCLESETLNFRMKGL